MDSAPRYRPFVDVFVPFALLLAAGNLAAEAGLSPVPAAFGTSEALDDALTGDLDFARVIYSSWLTFAFAGPALVLFFLYDLRAAPPIVYRYWQLSWAFGFLAYVIHSYLSAGVWFGWDFAQIERRQTAFVARTNYALLVAWGIDVLVSILGGQRAARGPFYGYQWLTHLLFLGSAGVASVAFASPHKTGVSLVLGVLLLAASAYALLMRLVAGPVGRPPPAPR